MIEQIGNTLAFYGFFVASGVGATGLTVTIDVYRNGTQIVTGGSATEVGGGLYRYTLAAASVTVEGEYAAIFKTTGTADQKHIPALWTVGHAGLEDLDATISSRATAGTVWDEVLTAGTHNINNSAGKRLRTLQDSGLYQDAAVWIDTITGTAGTVTYTNGTTYAPVNNIADARNLATQLGLRRFVVRNGSSITLDVALNNYDLVGEGWTLALGGQAINGLYISGAQVSGLSSGAGNEFSDCHLMDVTIGPGEFHLCGLRGIFTLASAGDYFFHDTDQGGANPVVDFGAALGASMVGLRWHCGILDVRNMRAGDTLYLDGSGRIQLDSSCTAGTAYISGPVRLVNNAPDVSIVDDPRYSRADSADAIWDEPTADHQTSGSTGAALGSSGGGGGSVTYLGPVASDGSISIVRGDDYKGSRALTFTSAEWPTLTGATVVLTAISGTTVKLGPITGIVTGTHSLSLELTAAQTGALVPAVYAFDIQATLADASIATLLLGKLTCVSDRTL